MTLNEALRELAQESVGQAPAPVEAALLREFRRRKRKRAAGLWVAIAAAAVAGALLLRNPRVELPAAPRVTPFVEPRLVTQASTKAIVVGPRKRVRHVAKATAPEAAGLFYPLPETETLAPLEYGTVVRVLLPRAALERVGLAVNEERRAEGIQAEVLVGQDGRARAVRFLE